MRALRAVFLLIGAAYGVFQPFVAVILSDRGASPEVIGVVTAASSAAFALAVPAWGHVADVVLGRRLALTVSALAAAVVLLLAGAPLPLYVTAVGLVGFGLFGGAWGQLGDALAVNAISDHGRDYGRIRLLSSIGFAVAATLAGFLYVRTGYGPAFVICAGLAALMAVAAMWVPDVARADLRRVGGGASRGGSVRVALQIQPRLWPVLAAIVISHLGLIAGFTFLPLRLVELGGGPADVALMAAAAAFAEIPALLVVGAIAARIGLRGLMAVSLLTYAACFASWIVLEAPALIILSRVATGLAFAGLWVSSVLTMTVLLPPRLQATGQGLYQLTGFGLAAVVANVGGGLLYGTFGSAIVFAVATGLAMAGAALAFVVFPRAGAPIAREEEYEGPLPLPAPPA
jgi:PPP family 3-phenylpropionic acid transporter